MILKRDSKIVFAGDSVTDCTRNRDAKLGSIGSLGEGYPKIVSAALTAIYPENQVMVVNKGVSGNTILDLKSRWKEDVIALKPDVVFILIGINDVWRFFDSNFLHLDNLVDLETYKRLFSELISSLKESNITPVIIQPFMFETNLEDPMRKKLVEYQLATLEVSEESQTQLIDIQSKINQFLKLQSSYILSSDRVHPNFYGHMLIAKEVLNYIDFDWNK